MLPTSLYSSTRAKHCILSARALQQVLHSSCHILSWFSMQSRPLSSGPAQSPPLGSNVEELNAMAQRWLTGDRSNALRSQINDKFEILLAMMNRLRDFTMTNPAHTATIGEAGLAVVAVWEQLLAHLPCGAASDCPQAHPLKPRPNYPKGMPSPLTSLALLTPCCRPPRPFMRLLFVRNPQGRVRPLLQNVRV
jgi:hypothetical protein